MKFIYIAVFLLQSFLLQAQIITTVAGNGTHGYSGDGGPATSAQLSDMYYCYPAMDSQGNIYIAQTSDNTIRKISNTGIISTIAGVQGVIGYTGDGGPAANALLYHPYSIAIDNNDNIYFTDQTAIVIRKIDPAGIITTASGQWSDNCGLGDGGPFSQARFRAISAISFDRHTNSLYISDYGCNTIRKVNAAGIVSTVAGNGTHGFSGDGGQATQAKLAYPCMTATDAQGNLYIADAQNHRIRKVAINGIITTFAGSGINGFAGNGGPAAAAAFSFPGGVVIDNTGNIYVGDYNHVIRKIDATGIINAYAGNGTYGYSGDGGLATQASIGLTEGRISIGTDNNIYFVNYQQGNAIRKITNCFSPPITQQPASAQLCNSGNAAFTVSIANPTSLQWQVNTGSGWVAIADNAVYSGSQSNTLSVTGAGIAMNNYQYRCIITNSCGSFFSAAATLTVSAPATPAVAVTASANNICLGTPVSFNATTQNAGTAIVYTWKKNGNTVGANSNIYTDNNLLNGDIIRCEIATGPGCFALTSAASNSITMLVNSPQQPAISISASANNICSGTPVTFTALPQNGGASPGYSWFKNNIDQSQHAATYTSNTLNNNDVIECRLTSSLTCITSTTVASAPVTMVVNALQTPAVVISASRNNVCRNTAISFTATAANTGSTLSFQWKKNGVNVGSNAPTYSGSQFINGDIVVCEITTTGGCLTASVAVSNSVTISILPDPVVALDKNNAICEQAGRILDAGPFVSWLWSTGETTQTIKVSSTGSYAVTVTDQNGCTGQDVVLINTINPSPARFLPADTSLCNYEKLSVSPSGNFRSYLWSTGRQSAGITLNEPGTYWLEVKDANGCIGKDTIKLSPKECMVGFYMPSAFTPNNDGKNDIIKPLLFGRVIKYNFRIYNRLGQLVFTSTDHLAGWDGTIRSAPQNAQTYVWLCSYQLEGKPLQTEKGSVILVR